MVAKIIPVLLPTLSTAYSEQSRSATVWFGLGLSTCRPTQEAKEQHAKDLANKVGVREPRQDFLRDTFLIEVTEQRFHVADDLGIVPIALLHSEAVSKDRSQMVSLYRADWRTEQS